MTTQRIALVGAGLAGCECALQLARRGFAVTLFEQKPEAYSPAHSMPQLAELVCPIPCDPTSWHLVSA